MAKKSKSKKNPDFQKVKLKAGKTKTPTNITDTTLNVKGVQIIQKIKGTSEATSHENFIKAISQCLHHSAKMRASALQILGSIIKEQYFKVGQVGQTVVTESQLETVETEIHSAVSSAAVTSKFPPIKILSAIGRMLSDSDPTVRSESLKTFEIFYKSTTFLQNSDFNNQILAHINCALNHTHPSVQCVGLKCFGMILVSLSDNISLKFLKILKSALEVCNSTDLKFTEASLGFIEKVGKLVRIIKFKSEHGLNSETGNSQGQFIDCSFINFRDLLNYGNSFSSETHSQQTDNVTCAAQLSELSPEIYKLILTTTLEQWPVNLLDINSNKKKVGDLLKLLKTLSSIQENVSLADKEKFLTQKVESIFPIFSVNASLELIKLNFELAQFLEFTFETDGHGNGNDTCDKLLEFIDSAEAVKKIFLIAGDCLKFDQVLEFFGQFFGILGKSQSFSSGVDSESLLKAFILRSILKINTFYSQNLLTKLDWKIFKVVSIINNFESKTEFRNFFLSSLNPEIFKIINIVEDENLLEYFVEQCSKDDQKVDSWSFILDESFTFIKVVKILSKLESLETLSLQTKNLQAENFIKSSIPSLSPFEIINLYNRTLLLSKLNLSEELRISLIFSALKKLDNNFGKLASFSLPDSNNILPKFKENKVDKIEVIKNLVEQIKGLIYESYGGKVLEQILSKITKEFLSLKSLF